MIAYAFAFSSRAWKVAKMAVGGSPQAQPVRHALEIHMAYIHGKNIMDIF